MQGGNWSVFDFCNQFLQTHFDLEAAEGDETPARPSMRASAALQFYTDGGGEGGAGGDVPTHTVSPRVLAGRLSGVSSGRETRADREARQVHDWLRPHCDCCCDGP